MAGYDKTVISIKNGLKLVRLCDKDLNEVMQFLMKHFTPFESTGRSVGMFGYDEWELTGAAARRCLEFPYSYAFRDENNEIIAACINDVIERLKLNETGKKENDEIFKATNEQGGNQSKKRQVIEMDRLICTLESKMWPLVPSSITKLLKIVAIATQRKYGRRGLMHELMTFDLAEQKRNGIQGAISKATAYNSQKLFAKLGYQVIYQINYDKWLDNDGKQIFKCDDGTNCAQLVYKSY